MKTATQTQQGDVFFERINALPRNAQKAEIQDGVFALGEATGHRHIATLTDAVTLYEKDGITYARISEQTEVVHEEHKPQMLMPGVYIYGQVKEYDYLAEMARAVID